MPAHRRRRGQFLPSFVVSLVVLMVGSSASASPAEAAESSEFPPAPITVTLEQVAHGIVDPIAIANAGDGSGRLFVNEQTGRVRIVVGGTVLPEPFLDVRDLVLHESSEQGLLGLAFHPDYPDSGLFYVMFTGRDNSETLMRFHVSADDPNRADPASGVVVLALPDRHPEFHNGGMLAFGPDGYLYISTGDEGFTYDEVGNAQSLASPFGKILRIDVDHGEPYAIPADNPFVGVQGARGEIWALGLRNPWRFSFDRVTGDMYIGDVGQDTWEEVNILPAGDSGWNYGWNQMEGRYCFAKVTSDCDPVRDEMTLPVVEYDHSQGCAVIGGFVYRGSASPMLAGRYLFADICTGALWTIDGDAAQGWSIAELLRTDLSITSFGEDESGEIVLVAYDGAVYRIVANDALQRTWSRTDEPVALGMIGRTWLWGEPVTPRMLEPYRDAPSGKRLVQYYDKSRMEVISPTGDVESPWYVTNGLLVVELVTGRLQLGHDEFEQREPAEVPVAGDPDNTDAPTYASIAQVLDAPPLADGTSITQRLARDGSVTTDSDLAARGVTAAHRAQVPGIDHAIAAPFWEFTQTEGLIAEQGEYHVGRLFPDPFYATGYPLSEAYWMSVPIGGVVHDVLVQCFERRCLTFTPDNPPAWQVEAGNVGQHYYRWRYPG